MKKFPFLLGPNGRGFYQRSLSVKESDAQQTNDAIAAVRKMFPDGTLSSAMRRGLDAATLVPELQEQRNHGLDILDSLTDDDISDEARDELRMAWTGCETLDSKVFTGELSSEYLARYSDE